MQTNWTQWLEQLGSELYSSTTAYQNLLPELADLRQHGREYRSSYKLNGEKRNRPDKTYIPESRPLQVHEHGDPPQNLVSYLMDRDHTSFIETVQRMAEQVGMELPQGDGWQDWKQKQQQKQMLETVQDYYKWCLYNTQSQTAAAAMGYLKSRFTNAEIDTMGLGFIPSKEKLEEHLRKYYEPEAVGYFIGSMPSPAGDYNHITIPIYIAGSVYSFIYRHHNQQDVPDWVHKYQYHISKDRLPNENPYGVSLSDRFLYIPSNLRKEPELVIVEGQLDCLHLQSAGLKNAVSTGTNNVNPKQVEDAIQRGCRIFTLLYDADPTDTDPQKNYTNCSRAANTIEETAERLGMADSVKVYIAELPQEDKTQKIDPDSYLKDKGAAAVQRVIENAHRYWQYELEHIQQTYNAKVEENGGSTTPKLVDELKGQVLDIYTTIAEPTERNEYFNMLKGFFCWADMDSLKQTAEAHRAKQAQAKAQKQAADLMKQAGLLMDAGKTTEALKLQNDAAALLAGLEAQQEYETLLHHTTKEELIAGLKKMPADLDTGLYIGRTEKEDNKIMLPAGGLSILAAPTSHGKTTMLVSMAVKAAEANPNKQYYLLSYEEAAEPITLKALSCYAGIELSVSNRSTLQHYLTTGSWDMVSSKDKENYKAYKEKEAEFFEMLEQGRLHIHYTDMVCENLCTSIKKLAASGTLGGVFIDYVQYLDLAPSQRNLQRYEQISIICKMLKETAVETQLPIILGAQFNRDVADPTTLAITSLGEGGEIERKAAYCIGFWNNDMPYMSTKNHKPNMEEIAKTTKGNLYDAEGKKHNHTIYATVLKNRSGVGAKAGTAGLLSFNGNIGTVGNYEEPADPTPKPTPQQVEFEII